MKGVKDKVYLIGVIITVLSLAGLSESFTGHGSTFMAVIWLVVGFSMVLQWWL